ncbi:hypothetical protein THL1_585 [Pseudomonas sp. TCU-HL1]|nr:hypothetical protein THL1_585 [Pseudomonas sp. TCU-HL1]
MVTDAITTQNPRNRSGSTGHVLAKRSVTFTEIRSTPPRKAKHRAWEPSQSANCCDQVASAKV